MFTILIDESGDAGIRNIRSDTAGGASPYMTLGAAVVRNSSMPSIREKLESIKSILNKESLHCKGLGHYHILRYLREIIEYDMVLFGVVSSKNTLGIYKENINNDSSKFYNKCVQFLFERVGRYMKQYHIPAESLEIVFEETNAINLEKMKRFLMCCQTNPHHPNTMLLNKLNFNYIKLKSKKEEPLLQIADLVAHALYKCVDKGPNSFGISEPRYLKELAPKFYGNPNNKSIIDEGLYCVHKLDDIDFSEDVKEVIINLKTKH